MLHDVEVFVRVVELGSFTKAADLLGTSKSVISKYVSRLEQQLDTRLLNRTTRRLSLTEAGQLFFETSKPAIAKIYGAVEHLAVLGSTPKGLLKINAPMSFGIMHLAKWLPEFLEQFPDISVDFSLDDRKLELIEPGFDISIRISELSDSSMAARRLGPCNHIVVASHSYLEKFGKPAHPQDLRDHPIAVFNYQDSKLEWHFEDADNQCFTATIHSWLTANNSLALREIVLQGAALSRMPTFLVGQDVAEGRLVNLFPELQTLRKQIYAVFPRKEGMAPKTRVFLDFLANKMTPQTPWDL